jgi:hypothetical protein
MIRLLTRFVVHDEVTATSFARLLSRLERSLRQNQPTYPM